MTDKVYEMLWDCRHCGSKKLLGLTHRHCPNCGAEQDATARYFPPDSEKVAVQDHVYHGADVQCPFCGNWMGRQSKHCGNCGGPLEGGKDAVRRQDQVVAAGVAYAGDSAEAARREQARGALPPAPPPKKSATGLFVALGGGAVLLALLFCGLLFVFWKKEAGLTVAGHAWKREVQIERFGPVSESDWCDQMPSGATSVRRSREVRSHKDVPDGEDCKIRKVDNGNGTFTEKRECKTRYKKEPVYGDRCSYQIEKWKTARTETASGQSLADAPRWPEPKLARTGSCVGCEREGKRTETYSVTFKDQHGETYGCDFPEARWAGIRPATSWKGEIRRLTSSLDCDSLQPAR
jgi:hypothetical protein